MNKEIIVYSQNKCPYCDTVKAFLKGEGCRYEERNIDEYNAFRQDLLDEGYSSTPVTKIGERTIVGFNPMALRLALEE